MTLETTRNKTIAFFDFDGTVTKKDTLLGFIINSFSPYEIIKSVIFLSPTLLKFLFKIENNSVSKEKIFCYFFRGLSQEKILSMGTNYALKKLPKIIRPVALGKIMWHKKQEHEVVIVTASTRYWIQC
jgi:phosphoserine phosphatase